MGGRGDIPGEKVRNGEELHVLGDSQNFYGKSNV
jgi:hypothetical protein